MVQLIYDYSECPSVNPIVIFLSFDNFGGQIINRSAESLSLRLATITPAKINQLDILTIEQNILEFEIPVNNWRVFALKVIQSLS
jgi:hypothetical protein